MADRRVVFVDKDYDAFAAARRRKRLDCIAEVDGAVFVRIVAESSGFERTLDHAWECLVEQFLRIYRYVVELEMDDWMLLPLPVEFVYRQPVEKFSPGLEEGLQHRDGQRLAETARTRHEEQPRVQIRGETVHVRRLVDVYATPFPERREVGGICGYRFQHGAYYTKIADGAL